MIRAGWVGASAWFPVFALGIAFSARAASPSDPLSWLERTVQAARSASYAGTFVHTNGDRTSTTRVAHLQVGGEEHERIEPLDGPPHEIVRRNDEMFCYFPDAKTLRLDRRITARFFPAILRASAEAIAANYEVKLGAIERVLGYDCQWIRLEPKDALRFAQRLCAELSTGLVLRAKTFNEQHQVIEQYTFTDLKLGSLVTRNDVRSAFETRTRQWHRDAQPRDEAKSVDTGWAIANLPAGFLKITELRRTLPGRSQPVSQIVLSDGLASVSVFVEPNAAPARTSEASTEDGTTSFFVRPMGENLVTVLGEVPVATAQQVGRSVARRP
ncbi:MAG TPA: MucB/RseB C-terminal domain-containing protein [Usitatibacter sp.]|nr:MucB/RseB C-terminal domain-containing protein [Usitatibacter sp.]